jgi:RNA polymerase sigma-70 factor (ECF subfamily)
MAGKDATERFVQQLTDVQTRLLAYIAMLVGDANAARDVLQETNLVLWRKSKEFVEGTDFGAWARSVARFQVLAYLRDAKRDRHLFDENLIEAMAVSAAAVTLELPERELALQQCLDKLTESQRSLLERRYTDGNSVEEIAHSSRRTRGSVSMSLKRIRQSLLDCIEHRLAGEASS